MSLTQNMKLSAQLSVHNIIVIIDNDAADDYDNNNNNNNNNNAIAMSCNITEIIASVFVSSSRLI